MSQDASTRQMFLKPSQTMSSSSSSEPFSSNPATESDVLVESYADRLMNDLFDDVERMLDGGIKTTVDSIQPDTPTEQNHFDGLVLPLAALSSQEALRQPETDLINSSSLVGTTASETGLVNKKRGFGRSYDRLLLGIGCVSVIVSLAAWLISQKMNQKVAPISTPTQVAASPSSQAQVNGKFADYMRDAIKSIDQKSQGGGATINVAAGSMPTVTVPATNKPAATPGTSNPRPAANTTVRTPNGLQRIYVPVYQLPSGSSLSSKLSVAPLPTTPQAAAPTAVQPSASQSVPGVARTLVGVMELGDRSAALIEINGIAQRYRVGESIGSSGWALVEVSKNQAVVRRNGEVRSIFIGQTF